MDSFSCLLTCENVVDMNGYKIITFCRLEGYELVKTFMNFYIFYVVIGMVLAKFLFVFCTFLSSSILFNFLWSTCLLPTIDPEDIFGTLIALSYSIIEFSIFNSLVKLQTFSHPLTGCELQSLL